MTDLTLIRLGSTSEGTSGYIDLPTGERLYSIEQPWRGNQPDVSCVPPGTYTLMPYQSPKHGSTWYLQNEYLQVGGAGAHRSYCELHSANWARQLEGCIALGLEGTPMFDPVTGCVEAAVENSHDAIEALLQALGPLSSGNTLTIVYANGAAPPAEIST